LDPSFGWTKRIVAPSVWMAAPVQEALLELENAMEEHVGYDVPMDMVACLTEEVPRTWSVTLVGRVY
jgi:hypothetical protein